MPDHSQWPPALRAALESPTLERTGWQSSLAPQLIGLFLWVVYFDQIPPETLAFGGVMWPVLGAGLAGILCYVFLYRPAAMWGMTTGRPFDLIATSTFGVKGVAWVPGLLLAVAAVVWLAVATDYSTALSLRALVLIHFLEPKTQPPLGAGRVGPPGGLFLVTSLLWCYASAFVGRYLVRVIAALMNVFPILPAVLLGVTAVVAFNGLRGYHAADVTRPGGPWGTLPGAFGAVVTIQMVFGFFAAAGLSSGDWGRVARDERDVRAAGWVGVVMASWTVATLAILTSAGAAAGVVSRGPMAAVAVVPRNYSAAVETLVAGRFAGAILLTFGLAALAPACYVSFVFSNRFHDTWPRVSRTGWTILGTGLAWSLVATGAVGRLFDVFSLVGGVVAPAAGAVAADYVLSRGVWPGVRAGYNRPGLLAWALGSVAGLTPYLGRVAGHAGLASWQPAAVLGFLVAFLVYLLTATLGLGSEIIARLDELPPPTPASGETPA